MVIKIESEDLNEPDPKKSRLIPNQDPIPSSSSKPRKRPTQNFETQLNPKKENFPKSSDCLDSSILSEKSRTKNSSEVNLETTSLKLETNETDLSFEFIPFDSPQCSIKLEQIEEDFKIVEKSSESVQDVFIESDEICHQSFYRELHNLNAEEDVVQTGLEPVLADPENVSINDEFHPYDESEIEIFQDPNQYFSNFPGTGKGENESSTKQSFSRGRGRGTRSIASARPSSESLPEELRPAKRGRGRPGSSQFASHASKTEFKVPFQVSKSYPETFEDAEVASNGSPIPGPSRVFHGRGNKRSYIASRGNRGSKAATSHHEKASVVTESGIETQSVKTAMSSNKTSGDNLMDSSIRGSRRPRGRGGMHGNRGRKTVTSQLKNGAYETESKIQGNQKQCDNTSMSQIEIAGDILIDSAIQGGKRPRGGAHGNRGKKTSMLQHDIASDNVSQNRKRKSKAPKSLSTNADEMELVPDFRAPKRQKGGKKKEKSSSGNGLKTKLYNRHARVKYDVRERKQHIDPTISCVLKTNF